jgi:hypothetical protein
VLDDREGENPRASSPAEFEADWNRWLIRIRWLWVSCARLQVDSELADASSHACHVY